MRWNKYTINTRTDAEELVCAMLSELGITSVEIDNFIPVPDADRVRSRMKSQTRRIGETIGKHIFHRFPLVIFLSNQPGKICRKIRQI